MTDASDYSSSEVSAFDMTTGQVLWSSLPFSANSVSPVAALDGGRLRLADYNSGASIVLEADGSVLSTGQPTVLSPMRFLGDTEIGISYDVDYGRVSAVVSATAFLDSQGGFATLFGGPEQRNGVEKCDVPEKESLRQEYRYAVKSPSCKSFVDAFPVATAYYQFGPIGAAGTWLVGSTYNWALVSPVLVTGVNAIMDVRNGSALTLNSAYRSPFKEWLVGHVYSSSHTQGIGADFHIPGIDHSHEELSKTTWDALRTQAKDPAVAQAIRKYPGTAACVEPWETMDPGTRHLHADFRPCPPKW